MIFIIDFWALFCYYDKNRQNGGAQMSEYIDDTKGKKLGKKRRRPNLIILTVDVLMYAILLLQMLYVFTGNNIHEITGIIFFVCFILHLLIKLDWIKSLLKGKISMKSKARVFSTVVTCLLFACIITLMLSSMGVSRLIFPWFKVLGSSDLHRYLASAALALAALHGGMYFYVRTEKKKKATVFISLITVLCLCIGLFGVPYINRHFRTVSIDYSDAVKGEKAEWKGSKPLVVYFTRLGNTDFDDDVDAVSGASLMYADDKLTGNDQLLADMLEDIIDCDKKAITLTQKKYPSSYNATISEASKELKANARPDIEPIDVSGYDSIILVYPLWWGTVPPAVSTFLESSSFDGKTIYLIATQGSSGFSSSTKAVKESAKGAEVIEVMSIYCDDVPKSRDKLLDWVKSR